MSFRKIFMRSIIVMAVLCLVMPSLFAGQGVKNIIFMVPDGMSIANVTAARIYVHGVGTKHLHFETLEQIGYQTTHSKNSVVTDSAAAASAWACGQKFNNGEISYHRETDEAPPTILELAKQLGKSTGLVATSTITHATPAAFGAHTPNRRCEREIARQYIAKTGVDVMLGGGKGVFVSTAMAKDPCGTWGDFVALAKEKMYKVVDNREDMLAAANEKRLLGLFTFKGMTPVFKKKEKEKAAQEPSLAEMTGTALAILEKNDSGFFLLVEGSQVDWANHANDLVYQVGETIAFDQAVKAVLDWLEEDKARKGNTLLIVVPDHGCGGFAVKGPYGKMIAAPGQYVEDGWIHKGHTGEDTIIWSQGPYSEHLGRAMDNTDLFHVMKAALYGKSYPH